MIILLFITWKKKKNDYNMWSNHEEESTNQEESIDKEEFVELSDMPLLEGNKEVKEGEGI